MKDEASRILALLGLARRAGRLAVGMSAVESMSSRAVKLLIVVASDLSDSRKEKFGRMNENAIIISDLIDSDALAKAFNRTELVVVAVDSPAFIKGIVNNKN
jgi:ribosomal protein L7Ae-like RNA K-turn-binding protein